MTEAVTYCREQNFARVYLWTFAELEAARHLYSSFGFRKTEEEENDNWKEQSSGRKMGVEFVTAVLKFTAGNRCRNAE